MTHGADSRIAVVRDYRSRYEIYAQEQMPGAFLAFLNRLYWSVGNVRRRKHASHPYEPATFTVGVGNITFGGCGKTPVVVALAREYLSQGKSVAVVLKRMDKRHRLNGKDSWLAGNGPLNRIGDEAALIEYELSAQATNGEAQPGARFCVLPAYNKLEAVRQLDNEDWDCIIVDDAFQLTGLIPTVNIAVICPDHACPSHSCDRALREPPQSLRRATHVLLNITGVVPTDEDAVLAQANEHLQSFGAPQTLASFVYRASGVVGITRIAEVLHDPEGVKQEPAPSEAGLELLKGKTLLAFSGIAHQQEFEHTLLECGAKKVYSVRYPNHHHYTIQQLDQINEQAEDVGADLIVTTMKDACRLGLALNNGPPVVSAGVANVLKHSLVLRVEVDLHCGGGGEQATIGKALENSRPSLP